MKRGHSLALLVTLSCAGLVSATPTFTNLGTLSGAKAFGWSLNADASVVIGHSQTSTTQYPDHAFRWTSAGMSDIDTLGHQISYAQGVSADGSVIVGYGGNVQNVAFPTYSAYIWTSTGGMQDLGLSVAPGSISYAQDVSADGVVVVGDTQDGLFTSSKAFRWTQVGGKHDIGTLGGTWSSAQGVNADGSVICGISVTDFAQEHAFRWTASDNTMHDLNTLGGSFSYAYGVSDDGTTVVGISNDTAGDQYAFRWTQADGMQSLGTLGRTPSYAYACNADGSVVVGYSRSATIYYACFWTQDTGMVNLQTYLTGLGVDLTGWTLTRAWDVNAEGTAIVGDGTYNGVDRTFLVTGLELIPTPCPADFNGDTNVDVADLFGYINAWLAKTPNADFNGDTNIDVVDLFGYINAWLAKC